MDHVIIYGRNKKEIKNEIFKIMEDHFVMTPSGIIDLEGPDLLGRPYSAAILVLEKKDIKREQNITIFKKQGDD